MNNIPKKEKVVSTYRNKKKYNYTIMYNIRMNTNMQMKTVNIKKGKREKIAYIMKEDNTWHEIIIEHGI